MRHRFQGTNDKHLGIITGKELGKKPEEKDGMGEEARENQNVAQETVSPNGAEGCNPCKPKTTMIPKVILEYPQTQLYRD